MVTVSECRTIGILILVQKIDRRSIIKAAVRLSSLCSADIMNIAMNRSRKREDMMKRTRILTLLVSLVMLALLPVVLGGCG